MGGMEPLIHSVTTTVAQDVRQLVHATQLEIPMLIEKDPPNFRWHWHLPLGFVTLAAAGALLIAAAGVQSTVQEQKSGARRTKTSMHKQKVQRHPAPVQD
jgi:hypothetical protein